MNSVVYCSQPSQKLSRTELQLLVQRAARKNNSVGLTGFLSLNETHYVQFLEGPKVNLETLMVKIKADSRHKNLIELSLPLAKNLCQGWGMVELSPYMAGSVNFTNLIVDSLTMWSRKDLSEEEVSNRLEALLNMQIKHIFKIQPN